MSPGRARTHRPGASDASVPTRASRLRSVPAVPRRARDAGAHGTSRRRIRTQRQGGLAQRRHHHLRRPAEGVPDRSSPPPTRSRVRPTRSTGRTSSAARRSSRPRRAARSTSATWPRRRPSSPSRPATRSRWWRPRSARNPRCRPTPSWCPPAHPSRPWRSCAGHTVAVQEGTVEQYYLVQALAKAHVPYSAVHLDNLHADHRVHRGDQRPGRRGRGRRNRLTGARSRPPARSARSASAAGLLQTHRLPHGQQTPRWPTRRRRPR